MTAPLSSRQNVPLRISLEPVSNALNSFALLNEAERLPGLNTWVVQTAAELTPEQRRMNQLLFGGLRDALTPMRDEPNFPSYLHNLGELNSFVLRKRVLEPLRRRFSHLVSYATPHIQYLLNDVQTYLDCVKVVQGEALFDAELQAQVYGLLQDPDGLQSLLISHLETLWKTFFAAEWKRVQSSLRWQVEMFTSSLIEEATLEETFYDFTGRRLPVGIPEVSDDTSETILIPSWHNGRHLTFWDAAAWDGDEVAWGGNEVVRMFFSEPPNYDVSWFRSAPVSRPELRARFAALADETRLRILELLTQRDEMHAQEIITALELSQSSVSRHLKQLVSMGYLYERRGEGANKTYRLSGYYIERTNRAIQQLISGTTPEAPQDEKQPQELRRFLDRSGKLTTWPPAKQRDKLLILEYLASFFEFGRTYNEKEVNEILHQHSTFNDSAALRRALNEYRFMSRTRDGSHYWLIDPENPDMGVRD